MNTLSEKHKLYFDKLRTELKKGRSHLYNIVHQMNIKPTNLYVAVKMTPVALSGVIAYIELIAFDITHECSYSMSEAEIMEIVDRFYEKVTYLEEEPLVNHHKIDLYLNWEEYASFPFEIGMPELHRDKLLEYIKEMSIRNNWRQFRI